MIFFLGSDIVGADYFFLVKTGKIFASENKLILMCTKIECNEFTYDPSNCEYSENLMENEKYIKRLELQRSVLNMLIDNDLNQNTSTDSLDPE